MSAPNGTVPPPPPSPPGVGGQPAWAWWVVGIVIPVIGIVVTLLTLTDRGSDDDGSNNSNAGSDKAGSEKGSDSDPAATAPRDPTQAANSAAPAAPAYGPADWTVEAAYGDAGYLELDTDPPQEFGQDTDGRDLYLDATAAEPVDAEGQIGPLPAQAAGAADPTEADCRTAIEKNGLSEVELTTGTRFCLQTGEGRIAYLRLLSAPVEDEGTVRFKVTVWGLPQ
ncbi:hypothetical protein [Streptomyces sp. NPDC003635]